MRLWVWVIGVSLLVQASVWGWLLLGAQDWPCLDRCGLAVLLTQLGWM